MGIFCRSSQRVKAVSCFLRTAPSLMFGEIINATLFEEKFSTTGVTQENFELPLPLHSIYLHQTQYNKMKSWTDPTSSLP